MEKLKKWIILLWIFYFLGISGVVVLFVLVKKNFFGKLPSYEILQDPPIIQGTEIYTKDGYLLGTYFKENRSSVSYTQIPPKVINFLIAIEDKRFFEHYGIDYRGFLRALIFAGKRGGGSTITQQLAKLLFHARERNIIKRIIQKLKEWVLAIELEKIYSKEEILEMYLNKFDFLYNGVGIKNAAMVYFGKELKSLTTSEIASLIAMTKNPVLFNPKLNLDKHRERRNLIIAELYKQNVISKKEYEESVKSDVVVKFTPFSHVVGYAPYFRAVLLSTVEKILNQTNEKGEYVIRKPDGSPYNLYSDGLKIYTTLLYKWQKYAEEAVIEHLEQHQKLFFQDLKNRKNFPFDWRISKATADSIIKQAIITSDRYNVGIGKQCAVCGRRGTLTSYQGNQLICTASDCGNIQPYFPPDSVLLQFYEPVKMKIFAYPQEKDTIMTPIDSIKYHKAILQAGFVVMNYKTGEIYAWVGGTNYKYFKYDHVLQSNRQPGSAFKPIIYACAINEGFSPHQEVPNAPVVFEKEIWNLPKDWSPRNADGKYGGTVTLEYALANSINTVTSYLVKVLSPARISEFAKSLNIAVEIPPVPSIALGTIEMSLLDITTVFNIFSAGGIRCEPYFIEKITDSKGNIIYSHSPSCKEVMSPRVAQIMYEMLRKVVDGAYNPSTKRRSGTGVRLRYKYGIKIPLIGKTGTTQFHSDGWFIGSALNFSAGAWVGAEDRAVRFSRMDWGQGASMALPIFAKFCQKLLADSTIFYGTDYSIKVETPLKELDETIEGEPDEN